MNILADVNVLLARSDANHGDHGKVAAWFASSHPSSVVTCPLTENGFVRIFGNPAYPSGPGDVETAMFYLRQLRLLPGHRFIPDSISLAQPLFGNWRGVKPAQLTDVYLLGLAVEHGLKFVTLDRRIDASLVEGGAGALIVIS